MLQKYKEIFYGVAFGVGAAVMDTAMDAHMQGHSVWAELIQHPPMLFYRSLFVLFGLALGWLLWQKNKRERDFRHLTQILERFHRECGRNALLLHTKLQVLLTRNDLRLSREAEELVQFAYQRSQELQSLVKEKLPPLSS
jgi:hypothetical protein